MRFTIEPIVGFGEVGPDFSLRPSALCRYLQEAAIGHAAQAGDSARDFQAKGFGWVWHRLGLELLAPAELGQTLSVATWSRGVKGFRAYREFLVTRQGQPVAQATSIWVYVQLPAGRPRTIPPELIARYGVTAERACSFELEDWQPPPRFTPEFSLTTTTRWQDFDPNGHLNNNAVYPALVETGLLRWLGGAPQLRTLSLQFDRGIPLHVLQVEMGILSSAQGMAPASCRSPPTAQSAAEARLSWWKGRRSPRARFPLPFCALCVSLRRVHAPVRPRHPVTGAGHICWNRVKTVGYFRLPSGPLATAEHA